MLVDGMTIRKRLYAQTSTVKMCSVDDLNVAADVTQLLWVVRFQHNLLS